MIRKLLSILAALVLATGVAGAYAAEGQRAETRFDVTGADRLCITLFAMSSRKSILQGIGQHR